MPLAPPPPKLLGMDARDSRVLGDERGWDSAALIELRRDREEVRPAGMAMGEVGSASRCILFLGVCCCKVLGCRGSKGSCCRQLWVPQVMKVCEVCCMLAPQRHLLFHLGVRCKVALVFFLILIKVLELLCEEGVRAASKQMRWQQHFDDERHVSTLRMAHLVCPGLYTVMWQGTCRLIALSGTPSGL